MGSDLEVRVLPRRVVAVVLVLIQQPQEAYSEKYAASAEGMAVRRVPLIAVMAAAEAVVVALPVCRSGEPLLPMAAQVVALVVA